MPAASYAPTHSRTYGIWERYQRLNYLIIKF
jgi:hypothetical protein